MPDSSDFATYARLLRLTPVDGAFATSPESLVVEDEGGAPRRRNVRSWWAVLLFVALPTLIGAIYFGLIASDRFESEARFVIRTPNQATPGAALSSLMQTAGVARAEDAFVVRDYLESRDAMTFLEQHADLRSAFANKAADLLWRFPNFFTSNTQEGLYWQYQRMMSVSFDSTTGVSTLRVQAFTPADAHRLSSALLDAAETLVNRLNDRARRDAIAFAEGEVDRMRQRALTAQEQLTAFRERESLIDPSQATLAILETIGRLSSDVAQVSIQLTELQRGSPGGPQIAALRTRQAAIESQIAIERQRLAGNATSIAPRIAEYERLMLEREFSERALIAALSAVELARLEAQRQHVYIERVAAPSRPDHPAYPWRIVWCLAILLISYMAFRIGKALVDDARRHADP